MALKYQNRSLLMNPCQILQSCREGDPLAVESFYREYQPLVYRLAVSFLQDAAEAEDVTQETFIIALDNLAAFRGDAALSTWLYGIALNLCRRRLRKRRGLARVVERLKNALLQPEPLPSVEAAFLTNDRDRALWHAIQALNEKHRLPVILFYYHDLPVAEIAQVLDLPKGTVVSRLHTARERLRLALADAQDKSEVER
jgi:RNA polymerase sigma-70 factor (ECF subfamily)